ncbi:MAG: ASKHA domain-containing protein [Clostridiales Family XIII bacterium]|jgi:uncharacterized 2Fe-2S/4Fe-4S cluster protein (DUF4445 family)|nr:ASKHA domain-containing protein [Clostridiales Family XIII bacterium]
MGATVFFPAENLTLEAAAGASLLDVIRAAGLPIEAVCNGRGTCGKCRVRVDGAEMLACETAARDGMRVEILSSAEEMDVLTESAAGGGGGTGAEADSAATAGTDDTDDTALAIAVDVGTTTVVVEALGLPSGSRRAVRGFTNPQRAYGADVLSRINLSMDDASLLSGLIAKAVDEAVADVLAEAEATGADVSKVVVAGNTTMSYLLLNLRCRSLGLAPFEPEFVFAPSYAYEDVFHAGTLACPVVVTPFLSSFVGGDITAGLAHIDRHYGGDDYILVDMGTNGEIAYRKGARLLATSTAAGPALEGGNITCGMSGIAGAIYAVEPQGDGFAVQTIGGGAPLGICGSGVIDLVAKLLAAGYVEVTGAFADAIPEGILCEVALPAQASDAAPPRPMKALRIAKGPAASNGSADIVFTQKDVREFQLAKGAIRAGIEILMKEMGGAPAVLYLAGGFGQNINLASAFAVGLLPPQLEGRVRFVGNTSLGGARDACLHEDVRRNIQRILSEAEEINLGGHPDFNDTFMDTMLF